MTKRLITLFVILLCAISHAWSIPQQPYPPKLINDFTNTLSSIEQQQLEHLVVGYADTTSTQISVVIVNDLEGQDKSQYAYQIGDTWGVGGGKFNNGVVILIVPKTKMQKGEIFIATGYGVEGALPDVTLKRIIENSIIPYFQQNQYANGIYNGILSIITALNGEYQQTPISEGLPAIGIIIFIIIAIIIIVIIKKNGGNNIGSQDSNHSGLPLWLILSMMGGGSGGRGGGSSSGGGFGGFGGGSFGGGGAGGSW